MYSLALGSSVMPADRGRSSSMLCDESGLQPMPIDTNYRFKSMRSARNRVESPDNGKPCYVFLRNNKIAQCSIHSETRFSCSGISYRQT